MKRLLLLIFFSLIVSGCVAYPDYYGSYDSSYYGYPYGSYGSSYYGYPYGYVNPRVNLNFYGGHQRHHGGYGVHRGGYGFHHGGYSRGWRR